MKINATNGRIEFLIDGPISEKTDIFDYKISDATEIIVDFDKMSFINSIGVKKWTLWVQKIPVTSKVILRNCPGLIMNQIAMIQGFLPRKAVIASLKAPYVCTKCSSEKSMLFQLDAEYSYGSSMAKAQIRLPTELKCTKCGALMEPDFIQDRFFSFLKTP